MGAGRGGWLRQAAGSVLERAGLKAPAKPTTAPRPKRPWERMESAHVKEEEAPSKLAEMVAPVKRRLARAKAAYEVQTGWLDERLNPRRVGVSVQKRLDRIVSQTQAATDEMLLRNPMVAKRLQGEGEEESVKRRQVKANLIGLLLSETVTEAVQVVHEVERVLPELDGSLQVLSGPQARFLEQILRAEEPHRILECGTGVAGYSSSLMAHICASWQPQIVTLEQKKKLAGLAQEITGKLKNTNIKVEAVSSEGYLSTEDAEPFDFVLVDLRTYSIENTIRCLLDLGWVVPGTVVAATVDIHHERLGQTAANLLNTLQQRKDVRIRHCPPNSPLLVFVVVQ